MRMLLAALFVFLGLGIASASDSGLYDRLGQKEGISRIASRLVDISLADRRIKEAFAETNVPRLKSLLTLFFCRTAGGPCDYPGRSMEEAHAGIGIRDAHFNALVENLQTALDAEGVPFATQNEFLALLAPMHRDVVKP